MDLLGPGLALIVAIIIFGLLLHFLENRGPHDDDDESQRDRTDQP